MRRQRSAHHSQRKSPTPIAESNASGVIAADVCSIEFLTLRCSHSVSDVRRSAVGRSLSDSAKLQRADVVDCPDFVARPAQAFPYVPRLPPAGADCTTQENDRRSRLPL